MRFPPQEAITRDNVTVKVNAVAYFRVIDPEEAVVEALDYFRAMSLIAQTMLSSILGQLPASMQRAMARQAEVEREKRAKVIHAEGELSASQHLAAAAEVIGSQPATLQLRYLQVLTETAAEKNSTIVFPLPLDLLQGFLKVPTPVSASLNGNVPSARSLRDADSQPSGNEIEANPDGR